MFGSVLNRPVREQVMLFYTPWYSRSEKKIQVLVFLLEGNTSVAEVEKSQLPTTKHIDAPRKCELVRGRFYTVDCPSAQSNEPDRVKFGMYHECNYKPIFVLLLSPKSSPVSITVRELDTSKEVWSVRLNLSELMWNRDKHMASSDSDPQTLLESLRSDFVNNVSDYVLDQLLDRLLQERVMHGVEVDTVRVKHRADKAQYVLDSVIKKGSWASSLLIQSYFKVNFRSELSDHLKLPLRLQSGAEGDQRSMKYLLPDSEHLGQGLSSVQGKWKLKAMT